MGASVGAQGGVVAGQAPIDAGAPVALKAASRKIAEEFKQIKVYGPNISEKYGQGRIFQIQYRGQTLAARLDYKHMKGSQMQPRLHLNVYIGGVNYHVPIDPRRLNDKYGVGRSLRDFFDRVSKTITGSKSKGK
jgi:hypothetical protein